MFFFIFNSFSVFDYTKYFAICKIMTFFQFNELICKKNVGMERKIRKLFNLTDFNMLLSWFAK